MVGWNARISSLDLRLSCGLSVTSDCIDSVLVESGSEELLPVVAELCCTLRGLSSKKEGLGEVDIVII